MRVTRLISEGNVQCRAIIEQQNEIGQLAAAFNQMVENLAEKQKTLEKTIKKLKQTQQELLESERLASIGKIAAGVAHEIGNPLTSVLGHTEIIAKRLKDSRVKDKVALLDLLGRIRKETERIGRIIRDLLQFSRTPPLIREDVDLNQIIKECVEAFKLQPRFQGIKFVLALKDDLPMVKGNSDQLQQVFANLIVNAADAMPNGGEIVITTREEGEWVVSTVTDNGVGIPPEEIKKIFEPFFTTKSPDKGTGLGLAISLKIIKECGGKLQAKSKVGEGTTFTIYLKKGRGMDYKSPRPAKNASRFS